MDKRINDILEFWFGDFEDHRAPEREKQKMWWSKNQDLDESVRKEFEGDLKKAADNELTTWLDSPEGTLALIILLDQFSRNIYRGTPRAFSFDDMAMDIARDGIAKGYDRELHPVMRIFFYLPFMHSEDLQMQRRSVELFTELEAEVRKNDEIMTVVSNSREFAVKHKKIIERFGRFPHRNRILGRDSTPDELEFLKQPESAF